MSLRKLKMFVFPNYTVILKEKVECRQDEERLYFSVDFLTLIRARKQLFRLGPIDNT